MKLIDFAITKDYGTDFFIKFFSIKDWTLFQVQIGWNDYSSWPFIQIKSGGGYGLSIIILIYKFSFDVDVLSRTWHQN